jgi:hypothetical protein
MTGHQDKVGIPKLINPIQKKLPEGIGALSYFAFALKGYLLYLAI